MDGEQQIKKAYESILGNDFEQAIDWFAKAIELEPDNADYHYKLSVTYARSGRLARALDHARVARKLAPDNDAYRMHLQHVDALELLEKAKLYCSGEPGQAYMAVTLLRQAVSLDPLLFDAYLLLGVAYANTDDFPQALEAVKEALKLDPQHAQAGELMNKLQQKMIDYIQD